MCPALLLRDSGNFLVPEVQAPVVCDCYFPTITITMQRDHNYNSTMCPYACLLSPTIISDNSDLHLSGYLAAWAVKDNSLYHAAN
jgi:hypothetical protein